VNSSGYCWLETGYCTVAWRRTDWIKTPLSLLFLSTAVKQLVGHNYPNESPQGLPTHSWGLSVSNHEKGRILRPPTLSPSAGWIRPLFPTSLLKLYPTTSELLGTASKGNKFGNNFRHWSRHKVESQNLPISLEYISYSWSRGSALKSRLVECRSKCNPAAPYFFLGCPDK